MKKILSVILAISVFMATFFGLSFQSVSADTLWGIDVSYYQGDINWTKVKEAGVDFAILRAGYEYTKDSKFEEYYAGAKAAGIPVGVYLYTYADNVDEATKEANTLINNLKGKTFEWPIYIDVEEASKYSQYSKDFVSNLVLTQLKILENAGYYPGVYTYTYFAKNYINMSLLSDYTTWIADYSSTCGYTGAYDMWQYSSSLSVSGVSSARCDTNYSYVNFEPIIKNGGYNGYEAESTPSQPDDLEDLLLIDGSSASSITVNPSHYYTKVSVDYGKTLKNTALKMSCNDPDSKASSTQVGGMMFYNFSSATNISPYNYFVMEIYIPKILMGNHSFQVNFVTSGEDGFNHSFDFSDKPAGWHTLVIPLSEVEMASSANWSSINKIRFTWFNRSDLPKATYFLIDNVYLSSNLPAGYVPPQSDSDFSGTYGDVDGNQTITSVDALFTLQYSIGKISANNNHLLAINVDGERGVTTVDALLILQKSLGKLPFFPCEII